MLTAYGIQHAVVPDPRSPLPRCFPMLTIFPRLPKSLLPSSGLDVCRCTVAFGGCSADRAEPRPSRTRWALGRKAFGRAQTCPTAGSYPVSVTLRPFTWRYSCNEGCLILFIDSWLSYFITAMLSTLYFFGESMRLIVPHPQHLDVSPNAVNKLYYISCSCP